MRHYVLACSIVFLISAAGFMHLPFPPASTTVAYGMNDDVIVAMMNQVNVDLIQNFHADLLRFGPRYTGTITCTLAGNFLFETFEHMGLDVVFEDWRIDGFRSRNIVATLPGSDPSSTAIFIVCAHYDTVQGSPGADDDASGVAAVLALADIMHQYSFNHTIRFIAFSGEEVGTYGSFFHARNSYDRGDNIVAVLNLDMIGYANTSEGGRVLRFYPPERSVWVAQFAAAIAQNYHSMVDLIIETRPNYIGSDAQPFVDYGYDAVWIAHPDGYPWGHSPNDTADHINWSYQHKVTKLMLGILAEFAFQSIDLQIQITAPFEGQGYFFNRPVVQLDLGKQWYKQLRGITFIVGRAMMTAEVTSNEPIQHVIFCVDGNFLFWDTEPPYSWRIQGLHYPLIGRHKLKVVVYTISDQVASDEMDIIIYSLKCAYN